MPSKKEPPGTPRRTDPTDLAESRGRRTENGSSGEWPAMTSRRRPQSTAVRAMGPTVSYVHEMRCTPSRGTSPLVVLMAVVPQ